MDYFQWAQNNLDVDTPHRLQDRGVQVYFSPNIPSGERLVDLENGNVRTYHDGEERPQVGYYAEESSLERYCREHNLPFHETSGSVSLDTSR